MNDKLQEAPVWFITGGSTGFGYEPLPGATAFQLANAKLDRLRANFDDWKDVSIGADFPATASATAR